MAIVIHLSAIVWRSVFLAILHVLMWYKKINLIEIFSKRFRRIAYFIALFANHLTAPFSCSLLASSFENSNVYPLLCSIIILCHRIREKEGFCKTQQLIYTSHFVQNARRF